MIGVNVTQPPNAIFVQREPGWHDWPDPLSRQGQRWTGDGMELTTVPHPGEMSVHMHCPQGAISRLALRWSVRLPSTALMLGDAWERGYGDLQWRHMQPERVMPWYFAVHDPASGEGWAAGVKVGPSAMCFWTADPHGVSLWLDLRNGGGASVPGDRLLALAQTVSTVAEPGESVFQMLGRFCAKMCPAPRLPTAPVCGSNNWYYAYGTDFDAELVRRDAGLLAEMAQDQRVRPFCVVDAGWSPGGPCPGGPWTGGWPDRFPDMPRLAADIRQADVRPGIWIRPTAVSRVTGGQRLRQGPRSGAEQPLDLTVPENLQQIGDDIRRMRSWGYELIKHDYSTFDAFGRWGPDMGAEITDPDWHWVDRSRTNAEVIRSLYHTLREAAGDALLLGCNTIGHLAAGYFEVQRTGDDTSTRAWERTRRMGVNTLAFRLPQHNRFFAADADCVGYAPGTAWSLTRQWLDVVARSGTPLFVSVDPRTIDHEVKQAMTQAMQIALAGAIDPIEPMDWLYTTCPQHWRLGQQRLCYDWTEPWGTWPLKCL